MIAEVLNILRGNSPALAVEDQIVAHYRSVTALRLKPLRPVVTSDVLSTTCQGLGDTMMLTDLPAAAAKQAKHWQSFSSSRHFLPLMSFNPYYQDVKDKAYLMNAPDLVRQYDCGNGHYLQRLRRVFGLKIEDRPSGFLYWHGQRNRVRVILHFDPGVHVQWQRKVLHKRARMIYTETREALKAFVASRPTWSFVEVGDNPLRIEGTEYRGTDTTVGLVNLIASGEWFIGVMSGPMHVATALGLKCVVIVNFPKAEKIFLPTLAVTGQVEEEWMYPQNVHLHQEGDGPLVKRATADNLNRAFDGELYPYWSDKYLPLIHEKL